MNRKWSLIGWVLGELILIACFLHFGRKVDQSFLILNCIVSSIIFSLFFIDVLFPMVRQNDKSSRKVGSLGIRWFFTFFYALVAIGTMLFFGLAYPMDILSQVLIHGIFLFLLSLGLWGAYSSSRKVESIYHEQKMGRSQVDEIKRKIGIAKANLENKKDVPADVIKGVKNLQEDIRYISPGNTSEALELEIRILAEINKIINGSEKEPIDFEKMQDTIQKCSRLFIERKQVYSN